MTDSTLRVLLVDDDPLWQRLIVAWLGRLRHPSFVVESGDSYADGLERLLHGTYDACIVDHQLGLGPTGFELLCEARRAGCDIPILLLTADGEDTLDVTALRAGAADYLEKASLTEGLTGRAIRYAVERGRSLEALRQSEARYRSVFEHAPHGMCRSSNHRFTSVNPALVSMLGYESEQDLMSIDIARNLFSAQGAFEQAFADVLRTGSIKDFETEWRRKDGRTIMVRLSVRLLSTPQDGIWIHECIVEDITEQRRLEAQFRQAQKMEAVGRLAGGIAHDFNNLLTAILGYAELLRDQLPDEGAGRDLSEIQRAGTRAADLTRQLLAFSRKQVMKPIVCDLNEVVDRACGMLRRVIGEDVRLSANLSATPVWINADPGQIEQVLMNLVVNARDAMPEGGSLTIATSTFVVDSSQTRRYNPMPASTYALLSVTDTGCGMDQETLSHLFEPFFTTKPRGKGTGLGLATAYGIVKQSSGFIWADSTVGTGTTFRTYLPLVSKPVDVATADSASMPPQRGAETILLVEDESSVRKLAGQVLKRHGYEVVEAASGDEAKRICGARANEFDLLLTDVVMPGTSGPALARWVASVQPGIRVLYMSGYAEQSLVAESGLSADAAFLLKPFMPDSLARKVRDVLDRPAVGSHVVGPQPLGMAS